MAVLNKLLILFWTNKNNFLYFRSSASVYPLKMVSSKESYFILAEIAEKGIVICQELKSAALPCSDQTEAFSSHIIKVHNFYLQKYTYQTNMHMSMKHEDLYRQPHFDKDLRNIHQMAHHKVFLSTLYRKSLVLRTIK